MRFDSTFSTAAYKHMYVTVVVNYRNYQSALALALFFRTFCCDRENITKMKILTFDLQSFYILHFKVHQNKCTFRNNRITSLAT